MQLLSLQGPLICRHQQAADLGNLVVQFEILRDEKLRAGEDSCPSSSNGTEHSSAFPFILTRSHRVGWLLATLFYSTHRFKCNIQWKHPEKKHTLRILFDQMSGHLVAQSKWHECNDHWPCSREEVTWRIFGARREKEPRPKVITSCIIFIKLLLQINTNLCGLKPHKFIHSQSWRPEAQYQGFARRLERRSLSHSSLDNFWHALALNYTLCICLHMSFFQRLCMSFPLQRNTIIMGLSSTPHSGWVPLWSLSNYIWKDSISK